MSQIVPSRSKPSLSKPGLPHIGIQSAEDRVLKDWVLIWTEYFATFGDIVKCRKISFSKFGEGVLFWMPPLRCVPCRMQLSSGGAPVGPLWDTMGPQWDAENLHGSHLTILCVPLDRIGLGPRKALAPRKAPGTPQKVIGPLANSIQLFGGSKVTMTVGIFARLQTLQAHKC